MIKEEISGNFDLINIVSTMKNNEPVIIFFVKKIVSMLLLNLGLRNILIDELIFRYRDELIKKTIIIGVEDLINKLLLYDYHESVDIFVKYLRKKPLSELTISKLESATGGVFHYSQEGEDILLSRIIPLEKPGYFIDIGAHHPTRFSNTYLLYRKGWRGLNIDATPGIMEPFHTLRPEDININCAISASSEIRRYYEFEESALNTFDQDLAETYINSGWKLQNLTEIHTEPLKVILERYWPEGRPITLMNIDVEGEEFNVLKSNNWEKFSPNWIIIEILDISIKELFDNPCITFLVDRGYQIKSKLCQSVILYKEE